MNHTLSPIHFASYSANHIHNPVPKLAPILDVTYGCIVYQEQVMQIFREIAGYSFGHADVVRRAISKKKQGILNFFSPFSTRCGGRSRKVATESVNTPLAPPCR